MANARDLTPLLSALESAVQREDSIAERFDAKTRQLLALIGVFFAVVQAVAFGSFKQGNVHGHERAWVIALAMGAIFFLAVAALASFRQQASLKVSDLDTERASSLLEAQSESLVQELCRDHLTMLYTRRKANVYRADRYQWTLLLAVPAVVITAAELIVALAVRLH